MGTMMGTGAFTTQTSLLQTREDRMLGQIQSLKTEDSDAKINKGATEFESMLLSTWLQQAEQSMATVPGAEDDEDSAGREQMMGLGTQSLATSMAASGGIGIAKMIEKAMHATENKAEAAAALLADPKSAKVNTGER